ncbi:hypothetical protein L2X99_16055 [Microbacterium sp. KUDC0406]|uniref:hypothetical protein n=1 Tax=Microbacterium sp. KUDC0406 TaxID=2909588 RepID=UPI001F39710C|nr:hypothetical protein [Microbacterium sp. KUDC0406]UJP09868.1 hypothetical protein L2X99_16055 [Microbacterium sp. KUDC0406]
MVDVDASGAIAVQRRRTWMAGGVLLLTSVLTMAVNNMPGAWLGALPGLLFDAALVILAIGLGRGGSVTARRPMGTGALIAFAVWDLVWPWVKGLVPYPATPDDDYFATMQLLGITGQVVSLILAAVAVTQIGRLRVVPRPWNWAPLWAFAAVVLCQVLQSVLVVASPTAGQDVLIAISGFFVLIDVLATAFLGVLAIVLATRRDPASVVVY